MRTAGFLGGAAAMVGVGALIVACSSTSNHSGFDDGSGSGGEGGANDEGGTGPKLGGNNAEAGGGCQGIGCQVSVCQNGTPTSLTGQVFDPAGNNQLYNVIVYVPTDPKAPLPPLSTGVSCDKCGATALNPVVSTLTDENGMFTLKGVPTMKGLPVVVQVGKWRKKITFDVTNDCAENKFTDKITLPKNGTEGDMPQIAVTTGGYDSLECLLLGMGIDQSEFVDGADPKGHVHFYKGDGGSRGADANTALWSDKAKLSAYDIVALSCEGSPITSNKSNIPALHDYVEAGGRVFGTHFQYVWFSKGPADFQGVAKWGFGSGSSSTYLVDQSFPKGVSFAKWLVNVKASSTLGTLPLNAADVTDSISSVNTTVSQAWVDMASGGKPDANNVKYFSFNAPLAAKPEDRCGRVVYGDIHVSGVGGETFPSQCNPAPGQQLSAQQKALEFLFFDLSSCVQSDSTPPTPPK